MYEQRTTTETGIAADKSREERNYWLKQLGGEWTKTRFYYDYKKAGNQEYKPGTVTFTFNEELLSRLIKVIKGSDVKLHMVLLTGLVLLLWKYTGNDDIIVGSSIYKQKVEGDFINTVLPLRNRLKKDMTFKALLFQVRQTIKEAVKNQNYPMDKLIYELDLPVSEGQFPLFDIALLLENIQDRRYIKHIPRSMTFSFLRTDDAVKGTLEYDSLLYHKPVIERIVTHFCNLLEKTLFDVDLQLSAVDVFSQEEKKQLLLDFNNTTTQYPSDKTLHELFAQQAEQTPDRIVLKGIIEETRGLATLYMTYRELNKKSNRLAALLKEKGVKPDTIVGIMEEPSIELATAIIGILKAGGAYLPLDPGYPQERINYMRIDSGTNILVKKSKIISDFASGKNAGHRCSSHQQLAYVIYTSGSTGKPKGVLIEHRNIINYVYWRINEYHQTSLDISLQLVSFSFDGFCTNFYPPLLSGGTVVFIGQDKWRDTDYIRNIIKKEGVTNFSVVPSMYRVLLDGAREKDFKSMRFVVLAGEKAAGDLIQRSKSIIPGIELINEYGPSENAVTTTCKREMTPTTAAVIGRPISNNRVFILDEHQHLKPMGVPGELCVSGAGLARGYLNHPELTAQKFLFGSYRFYRSYWSYKSYVLYKTGDLARWLPDGTLEILGRIDSQVQIRGFRIEPNEIEKHLLDHHNIKEAAVIVKEAPGKSDPNIPAYNYLCAYIVPGDEKTAVEELRKYLLEKLPDYMVPTYLLPIKALPLTPNGKIDRNKLAELKISTGIETEYIAPRNQTEKKLAKTWRNFLERDRIGIKDNFFNIGGDSIKTIGLLSLINKEFNTEFDLVDLYENDTIETFARKIDNYRKTTAHSKYNDVLRQIEQLKEKILENEMFPRDREIEDIYPMSDIEKGMVYYSFRDTSPTVYYNQVVYQLEHRGFDEKIFKKAFALLVEKHSILRTAFNTKDLAKPVQIVYQGIPIDIVIKHEDISHLDRAQQEVHINAILKKDRAQPFDIERPEYMWRIKIFRVDNKNIIFIWIGHHALIDGWSSASLVAELHNIYLELKTNPDFLPGKLKATYKDFVVEQLVEKQNNETIDYWKQELEDYKRLKFPGSFKSGGKAGEIKTHTLNLGSHLLEGLTGSSRKYGAAVKGLCFAAYFYMLNMLSYQNDIVVGYVTNNRPNCEDGDKIIGCFLNTIPYRMKIPASIKCSDYIQEIEKKLLELKRYEKLSLFEIVRLVGEETQAQNPLFDTIFNFVDFHIYHRLRLQAGDHQGTGQDSRSRQLKIDGSGSINTLFNFDVNITRGDFYISLSYSNAIIDDALALNCCYFFENLLKRFIHEPDSLLEKGGLLPSQEKQKLLADFNRSQAAFPHDKTLHQLFEIQVAKTPDKAAAVSIIPEQLAAVITYKELNRKSDQLAYLLQSKGVKPDTVVGIMVERSLHMIIMILGILKAGGAYLPIDPGSPEERKQYMLADSSVRVLLSSTGTSVTVKEGVVPSALTLSPGPSNSPIRGGDPKGWSMLAYLIYTSGTTGKPKGVMVEHRNAVNTVTWFGAQYRLRPGIHLLMMSDYTFDASVNQLFGSLLHGAVLYMIDQELLSDIRALRQLIKQKQIHIINFVPAFLNELLADGDKLESLQAVISGAEPLEETFKEKMLHKGYSLYNQYGPTETTIDALCSQCTPDHITLGKPIANVQCFILDSYLDLLPIGVPGELFIAGAGVTRGYLNRPELTAQKFLYRSYRSYKSYILYKTGDLAWWLPDGNIEFLGRIDRQVKIRGYRIELAEIENQLLNHGQIKEAVVLTNEKDEGDKYLCAYIVPGQPVFFDNTTAVEEELRNYLSQSIPNYMIPSYFVPVEKIPKTPGGKIDLSALPAPGIPAPGGYAAPRNEIEKKLVEIWSEVLEDQSKTSIGIYDNFFQLGGHSLKAMVLVSLVRKTFNVELPLGELFRNPCIKALYQYIVHSAERIYQEIKPVEKKEYYALSSAQKRLYFLQQMDINSTSYNMPQVLPLGKNIQKDRLESALKTLIARHESLRTSFFMVKEEPVQKIHQEVEFEIEYYNFQVTGVGDRCRWEEAPFGQVSEASGDIIRTETGGHHSSFITHHSFIRPFDLAQAPLIRSSLIKLPDNNHTWIVYMHHIISDGTSMSVLAEDFQELYSGETLPGLKLQYKDFSRWQNGLFEKGVIHAQEDYWLESYADSGEIPRLQLPADYKRPEVFTFEGNSYDFMLERDKTVEFRALGARHGCTLYMNVLAALNALFYKYTGQTDIIIGTGIAGRPHADLQRIIGMFVNTLAMRNVPQGEKTYQSFLKEVAENSIRAFENQDVQFEELVDLLEVERNPSRNPLFDISMVVQNFRPARSGIELPLADEKNSSAAGEYESRTAKFDMTFFIIEEGEDVYISIEYYTGIFKPETIQRLAAHFKNVIKAVIKEPHIKLKDIGIITGEERKQLLYEFNDTVKDYPQHKTIHELFEEQVEKTPDNIAIVGRQQVKGSRGFDVGKRTIHVTYSELNKKANQLANYLYLGKKVRADDRVGILMDRSIDLITAIQGILKAGGAYVPIDPSLPQERVKYIVTDACIGIVISEKKYVKDLNRFQWECDCFHSYLCMDSENIHEEDEAEKNELMTKELWHHVGETAEDEITGGGWISSYTGKPFSKAEMDEYGDNILKKLEPLLHPRMRVLEIGCASGISMYRIAPKVGLYYGTDLSNVIIHKNKKKVQEEHQKNIKLVSLAAHEILQIKTTEKNFDLLIMNSVIQCFHGHNYLVKVIRQCIDLLGEKGYLFIGDIMDLQKKNALIRELVEFKNANINANRNQTYNTKTDFSSELFVSREFWKELAAECQEIEKITFSDKIHTIENELTKFRYDALITINKKLTAVKTWKKQKYQEDRRTLCSFASEALALDITSNRLAYIIYTSGTTGKPKGVEIEHRGVVNTLLYRKKEYGMNPGFVSLQLFSYGFDGFVTSFFTPVISGSKVVLMAKEQTRDIDQTRDALVKNRVTHFICVPSLYSAMIASLSKEDLSTLKVVTLAGEKVSLNLLESTINKSNTIEIASEYGVTEASVMSTCCRRQERDHTIKIGHPIWNTSLYILDEAQQLQPIGAAGELCISGHGLARGYLNNPELTAQKFLFGSYRFYRSYRSYKSYVLYKTGDLARWFSDGNIQFLGRIDQQVKIRGHRIELGEIENQLMKHVEIKEAVVVDKKHENHEPGNKYLCAYVVPRSPDSLQPTISVELKEYLSQTLPDYMIPAHFIQIKKIPLTSSGKLNRNALPGPEFEPASQGYVPPANQVEENLAATWQEVLGVARIGIIDNFFEVGGDSIKAIQVAAKLKSLGLKLEIRDLFLYPQIKDLSKHIKRFDLDIPQGPVQGNVDLTPIQHWLFHHPGQHHHFNQPVLIYRKEGFEEEKIRHLFRKIVEHHDALRMVYEPANHGIIQRNQGLEYDRDYFALEVIHLQGSQTTEIEKQLEKQANPLQESIDLESGPLVKLGLFKTGSGDYLLMILHHLVVDGVSWRILLEDITSGYRQLMAGETMVFPQKTHSFQFWAHQLRQYSERGAALKELDYWKALEEMEIKPLPTDAKIDTQQKKFKNRDNAFISLDEATTEKLLKEVHPAYHTEMNDILLTALALAVNQWCGIKKIAVNLEGHGREEIIPDVDISRTVGWFTTRFPVVLDIFKPNDLSYSIKHIKENLRQIPNRGIGYGILKYLTPQGKKSGIRFAKEPEISFNYLGQFMEEANQEIFQLSGLGTGKSISPEMEKHTAVDINAVVVERKFTVYFDYNRQEYRRASIKKLLEAFRSHLLEIIDHCTGKEESEITPADLDYSHLSIDRLEELEKQIGEIDIE